MKLTNELPPFKKMTRKALYTLRKRVKIGDTDIVLNHTFTNVLLDQERLANYTEFFEYTDFPLTYLYILAQRAQLALMLQKEFTIPIPGMIHLTNNLELVSPVSPSDSFNIVVNGLVPTKEFGSLHPSFKVEFFQNDKLVVFCESGYLVKRKNPNREKKKPRTESKQMEPDLSTSVLTDEWGLPSNMGKQYAKVSGDNNPIHKSKLFARFAGFKHPIIHGWYSVSRAVKAVDQLVPSIKKVSVQFMYPIYLPGKATLDVLNNNGEFTYVVHSSGKTFHLSGTIG